ncbi:hypothetical protein ACFL09_05205 [Planctomycetota bacterium]
MLKGKLTYICAAALGGLTILAVVGGIVTGRLEADTAIVILTAGLAFAGGFIGLRRAIANGG